jgi:hypothetical protein
MTFNKWRVIKKNKSNRGAGKAFFKSSLLDENHLPQMNSEKVVFGCMPKFCHIEQRVNYELKIRWNPNPEQVTLPVENKKSFLF